MSDHAAPADKSPARATAEGPDRPDCAAIARFKSMLGTGFDGWSDGVGYPLEAIDTMDMATREELVRCLPIRGWREVKVLAALDLPSARSALRCAFDAAGKDCGEIGLALLRWSPACLSDAEATQLVCQAIARARGGDGLDAALEAAQAWHPAPVIDALWQALRSPDPVVIVNAVALLFYLHGLAAEPFDGSLRPQFLRFASDDEAEREAARAHLQIHMERHPAS